MESQTELLTRDQVPVEETWDLSTIYADLDAWERDLASAPVLLATASAHQGSLGESPDRLQKALEDSLALRAVIERLYVYAKLRSDENTSDSESIGRMDRVMAFSIQAGQEMAFFDPELLALPEEHLTNLIAAPQLQSYRHQLEDLLRQRPHTRSIEIEQLLAQSADLARGPRETFNALDNADLEFGSIEGEDGQEIKLTKGRYMALLESKNRDLRERAFNVVMKSYEAHKHTLAAVHASSVRKDVFYARARGHESVRGSALFDYNIPGSVYDSLIEATREATPSMERYFRLRKRALGIDELATYDLYVPLAAAPERNYEYREAIDLVLEGVAPLGEQYRSDLATGLNGRWVDVRETKGKRSGAYSWSAYGRPPVILMNWNGTVDHVFTLTHEAGHAMHTFYSDKTQPYHTARYSIFLAEIASTLNEVLLTWHMLSLIPESDVKGRFAILNRLADTISSTLIRQTMFAEFEYKTHKAAEAGQPLTLDTLNAIYGEVFDVYNPGVLRNEFTSIGWSRVPHFYNAFYVYQYATGISAGIALARQIRDEGQPAVDRYLTMLSSGGADYPLEILRKAGVDLTSPEPVRSALQEFDSTVAELENLADRGAFEA